LCFFNKLYILTIKPVNYTSFVMASGRICHKIISSTLSYFLIKGSNIFQDIPLYRFLWSLSCRKYMDQINDRICQLPAILFIYSWISLFFLIKILVKLSFY
jgi:hypothetical protein